MKVLGPARGGAGLRGWGVLVQNRNERDACVQPDGIDWESAKTNAGPLENPKKSGSHPHGE